ncbi:MAG: glycosyltransferase family protein [Candidatus Omnitrophica bacterium]|nr:glycosyltransferase family protein [Candidatus Omnitrophota bacterium]
MRYLAVIQARMSSSRLPGKVLLPVCGKPLLALMVERVRRATRIDHFIIATSTSADDDAIKKTCDVLGVPCFRGSLDDVLDRYYQAALAFQPENVIRMTADCPVIDPEIVDRTIDFFQEGGFDYVGNALKPTFPDGLNCEVMTFRSLQRAWQEADRKTQREHVTLYIYQHPEQFKLGSFEQAQDLSHLRWTVDHPCDLELIRTIYEELYSGKPEFGMNDILTLLKQKPELIDLNAGIIRNEALKKSLVQEKSVKSISE